jgi:hypothetical protein
MGAFWGAEKCHPPLISHGFHTPGGLPGIWIIGANLPVAFLLIVVVFRLALNHVECVPVQKWHPERRAFP